MDMLKPYLEERGDSPIIKKMARLAKQNESRIYEIYRKLKKTKRSKSESKIGTGVNHLKTPKSENERDGKGSF